jgi:hypothetical protein
MLSLFFSLLTSSLSATLSRIHVTAPLPWTLNLMPVLRPSLLELLPSTNSLALMMSAASPLQTTHQLVSFALAIGTPSVSGGILARSICAGAFNQTVEGPDRIIGPSSPSYGRTKYGSLHTMVADDA